jgi:hypothetical protein
MAGRGSLGGDADFLWNEDIFLTKIPVSYIKD